MISALDLQIRVNWARGGGGRGGDKKKKVGENGVGRCGGERGNGRGPACIMFGKLPALVSVSVSFLPDGENGKEEPAKQDQGVEQRGRGGLVPCLQFKLRKSRSEGGRGGGSCPFRRRSSSVL